MYIEVITQICCTMLHFFIDTHINLHQLMYI